MMAFSGFKPSGILEKGVPHRLNGEGPGRSGSVCHGALLLGLCQSCSNDPASKQVQLV
jgi:hypothetical protein